MPVLTTFTINEAGISALEARSLHRWLRDLIRAVEISATTGAPRDEGELAASGSSSVTPPAPVMTGTVTFSAPHAVFVHEGTRPHGIDSHGDYPLRNRKTGQIFGRHVNHPGNAANPFLREALNRALVRNGLRPTAG